MNRQSMKYFKPLRLWQQLFILLGIAALVLLCTLLWMNFDRSFPDLAPGSYLGTIDGVVMDGEPVNGLNIYLERARHDDKLFVALFRPDWAPKVIPLTKSEDKTADTGPLYIKGEYNALKLSGALVKDGEYSGIAINPENRSEGVWHIELVKSSPLSFDIQTERKLKALLAAKQQLFALDTESELLREEVENKQEEIESLKELLADGDAIRRHADERFMAANTEFNDLQKKIEAKREILTELERQFKLAERVTKRGKLTFLARESLARENRWIDSMLKAPMNRSSADLQKALTHANEVLKLQKDIALEKQRLNELSGSNNAPSVPSGESSFDSLWR